MVNKRWLSLLVLAILFLNIPVCVADLPRHVDPSLSVAGDPYPAELAELYGALFEAVAEEDYGAALEILGLGADMEALSETKLIIDRYNELIVEEISSLNASGIYLSEAASYLSYVQTDMVDDVLLKGIGEMSDANITLGLLFEVAIQLGNKLDIPQEELLDDLRLAGSVLERYYSEGRDLGDLNSVKEMLISDKLLSKTFVEIMIKDPHVPVGDLILVEGYFGAVNGSGLSEELMFYVDGEYIGRAVTDSDGAFYVGFPAPEVYRNSSLVWVEYWPTGSDVDVLTPTKSNVEKVVIGFDVPELVVDGFDSVYPGKTLELEGVLLSNGEPVTGVGVNIDDRYSSYLVYTDDSGGFTLDLPVPETVSGNYSLTIQTDSSGLIGPSRNILSFPVSYSQYSVTLTESRLNFAGGFLQVAGRVNTKDDATFFITFQGAPGRFSTTTVDNEFTLKVPLSYAMSSAWYRYTVDVKGNLPWLASSSVSGEFLVVSPLIPFGFIVLASYLALNRGRLVSMFKGDEVVVSPVIQGKLESSSSGSGSVFDHILGLFGVEFTETQTFREYLAVLSGRLEGQVYEYVRRFVLLYEGWVYGGSKVEKDSVDEAEDDALRRLRSED